jgi:hypothetical protein
VPLKSKAQMRYLFAAQARGDVPAGTAEKFVAETPKGRLKALPEYAAKAAEKDGRNLRKLRRATKKRPS